MSDNESISLADATKRLRFNGDDEGRRLYRELRRREAVTGAIICTVEERGRKTYKWVTIAAIRKHAPDLIPGTGGILAETREYLRSIDDKIDNRVAEQVALRVTPEIERLDRQDEEIAETLKALAARVNRSL